MRIRKILKTNVLGNFKLYEIQFLPYELEKAKPVAILQSLQPNIDPVQAQACDVLCEFASLLETVFAKYDNTEQKYDSCFPFSNDSKISECINNIRPMTVSLGRKSATFAIGSFFKTAVLAEASQSQVILSCDIEPNMITWNCILLRSLLTATSLSDFKETVQLDCDYTALKKLSGKFDINNASIEIESIGASHPLTSETSFKKIQDYFGYRKIILHIACDFYGQLLSAVFDAINYKVQFVIASITNLQDSTHDYEKHYATVNKFCGSNTTILFGQAFDSRCYSAQGPVAYQQETRKSVTIYNSEIPTVEELNKYLQLNDCDKVTALHLKDNCLTYFAKVLYQLEITAKNPNQVLTTIKRLLIESKEPFSLDDIYKIECNKTVIINHVPLVTLLNSYNKWKNNVKGTVIYNALNKSVPRFFSVKVNDIKLSPSINEKNATDRCRESHPNLINMAGPS